MEDFLNLKERNLDF